MDPAGQRACTLLLLLLFLHTTRLGGPRYVWILLDSEHAPYSSFSSSYTVHRGQTVQVASSVQDQQPALPADATTAQHSGNQNSCSYTYTVHRGQTVQAASPKEPVTSYENSDGYDEKKKSAPAIYKINKKNCFFIRYR